MGHIARLQQECHSTELSSNRIAFDSPHEHPPMSDTLNANLDKWEGALGPQSEDEPIFYELREIDSGVRLVGPSPGMAFEYSYDEFDRLIEEGEWILANDDWENQVYSTPDGEHPY